MSLLQDFVFLDYIWRGLVVGTLASCTFLILTLVVSIALARGSSPSQKKAYFNGQGVLLLLVFLGSFLFIAMRDPELERGCFSQFMRGTSSAAMTRSIAGMWAITVFTLLCIDGLRIYLSLRATKDLPPLEQQELSSWFEERRRAMGVRDQVTLCVAREDHLGKRRTIKAGTGTHWSPFVCGIIHYKIVVPEIALKSLSLSSLENILAHELVHARDRDVLWLMLSLIHRRLLFFNPLLYFLDRRQRLVVEMAADEGAIVDGKVQAEDLLKAFLELIEKCQSSGVEAGFAALSILGVSGSFQDLKERIRSLSQIQRPVWSPKSFRGIVTGAFMFALSFSGAQARNAVEKVSGEKDGRSGGFCSQARHEQMIESWFHVRLSSSIGAAPRSSTVPEATSHDSQSSSSFSLKLSGPRCDQR